MFIYLWHVRKAWVDNAIKKLQCQKIVLQFYLLLVRLFIHVDVLLTLMRLYGQNNKFTY